MSLVKATLKHKDDGDDIVFMFNPAKLTFSKNLTTIDNAGARSARSGRPRVAFGNMQPKTLTLSQLYFDTYETGEDVVKKHIQPFIEATKFLEDSKLTKVLKKVAGNQPYQRPPAFSFVWGKNVYFDYCFVEQLNYELIKFLPDGTPVRAIVTSLTLKETDKPADDAMSIPKAMANAAMDNRSARG